MAMSFLIMIVFLVVPLIGGIVLIVKSRRRGLGYPACGTCHYNVTGTVGNATRCPECGADLLTVGVLAPQGQRNTLMLWFGIVLLAIPLSCAGLNAVAFLIAAPSVRRAQQAAAAARQNYLAQQQQQAAATQTQPSATSPDQSENDGQPTTTS